MGAAVLTLVFSLASAAVGQAEPISPQDRGEIERLRTAHNRPAEDVEALLGQVTRAAERGLPDEPLLNKVKEGLAKGVEPKRIETVLRDMAARMETAQAVLDELGRREGPADSGRRRAVEMLADAMARGMTADDARELVRQTREAKIRTSEEAFAAAAKGVAVMKEAGVPFKDGASLQAEALKQGFRSADLLELAREIKRRGREIQDGTLSLTQVQDAVRRGERPERIFRGAGSDRSGRGSGDRPDRGGRDGGERMRDDRGARGELRPDRIERPDRSGPSDRPERPERLDRSGRDR
ncbi:hypothetical protein [Candidatus Nitrospira bockiana]